MESGKLYHIKVGSIRRKVKDGYDSQGRMVMEVNYDVYIVELDKYETLKGYIYSKNIPGEGL